MSRLAQRNNGCLKMDWSICELLISGEFSLMSCGQGIVVPVGTFMPIL